MNRQVPKAKLSLRDVMVDDNIEKVSYVQYPVMACMGKESKKE